MKNILYRIKLSIKNNVKKILQEFLLSIWKEIRRDKSIDLQQATSSLKVDFNTFYFFGTWYLKKNKHENTKNSPASYKNDSLQI